MVKDRAASFLANASKHRRAKENAENLSPENARRESNGGNPHVESLSSYAAECSAVHTRSCNAPEMADDKPARRLHPAVAKRRQLCARALEQIEVDLRDRKALYLTQRC
jgi:hypothetical protein